ncbi:MAG: Pb-fam-3 protein [SAR86 cluster bacterium SAR86B]|uniref:Pb-fam-3 protein n=1 Tax=SAR86 cluster bacterium SAR86B TaxID=1123867 RepID=J5KDI1_9GAMM|nr:MAG: Pb-fam-3 protein [SAR86 cluster bacterium SAR86B]
MDINKNLEICISAVTLAGNFLKENKEILNITNSSDGRDIKLLADIESEKLITKYFKQIQIIQFLEKRLVKAKI